MSDIALTAALVACSCALFSAIMVLRLYDSLSKRVKALEHFIYPEWEEERGWKIKTEVLR